MIAPTELLPCPHCGSATAPKLKPWDGDPPMPGFYVVCDAAGWEGMEGRGCGCSGAYGEDEGEAVAAWNRRALPASEAGWPEREDGVDEIVLPYAKFISARPELVSLLYDIDMLPEQCVTRVGAVRLAGLCEVWRKGEDGSLPAAPDRRAGE